MSVQVVVPRPHSSFLAQVEALSGQRILRCNQCAKCTAGCPSAPDMDFPPRRVMRALQLGLGEELLRSSSIWTCLYCRTCSVRCPMEIDVDRVLEAVRLLAVARRQSSGQGRVAIFHRFFLRLLRWGGRIYDLGLGALFNLSQGRPWANMGLFVALVSRRRMAFLPPRTQGAGGVKAIFARVKKAEEPSTSVGASGGR